MIVSALLSDFDPMRANAIAYKAFLARNQYHNAFEFFTSQNGWTEEIIEMQIDALLEFGAAESALALANANSS